MDRQLQENRRRHLNPDHLRLLECRSGNHQIDLRTLVVDELNPRLDMAFCYCGLELFENLELCNAGLHRIRERDIWSEERSCHRCDEKFSQKKACELGAHDLRLEVRGDKTFYECRACDFKKKKEPCETHNMRHYDNYEGSLERHLRCRECQQLFPEVVLCLQGVCNPSILLNNTCSVEECNKYIRGTNIKAALAEAHRNNKNYCIAVRHGNLKAIALGWDSSLKVSCWDKSRKKISLLTIPGNVNAGYSYRKSIHETLYRVVDQKTKTFLDGYWFAAPENLSLEELKEMLR